MPRPTVSDPVDEAYQYWKAVRARLAHTILDFSDACDSLNAALSCNPVALSLRPTLLSIDAEIPTLVRDATQLSDAHRTLSTNRNCFKQLSPIGSLPLEILSQIFLAAVRACMSNYSRYVRPDALASVCSTWRKAAINLPSLWSHIDLPLNGTHVKNRFLRAKTKIQRAQGRPLFVHLTAFVIEPDIDWSSYFGLLDLLAPLANNIESLCVSLSSSSTQNLVRDILIRWIKRGFSGSLQRLEIDCGGLSPALYSLWVPPDSDTSALFSPAQLDAFVVSVQHLNLRGFLIPWTSMAYHGLVHLAIDSPRLAYRHTQAQLVSILRSSPKLRHLELRNVQAQPGEQTELEPVFLVDLETLVIEEDSCSILRLLAPGLKPLRMHFLYEYAEQLENLRSFFSRSTVETLRIVRYDDAEGYFPFVLGQHKHLKTLVLERFFFDDRDLANFLSDHSSVSSVPWPRLRTLYLSGCYVPIAPTRQLLSLHSIQALRFNGCFIDGEDEDYPSDTERADFLSTMSEVVPDTAWLDRIPDIVYSD